MAERLTKKIGNDLYIGKHCDDCPESIEYCGECSYAQSIKNQLGKLEDILEKYGIESVELLEHIIKKGIVINSTIEDFAKEEYDKMKQDRDTWKKTCELIVKELNKLNTDKCKFCCYQESNKDYGSCDCDEQFELDRTINYFYQQAKKEKENE